METSSLRKKWIKNFMVGSVVLAISCAVIGYFSFCYAQRYYFNQLENLIIDKYMKGNNEIGVYSFDMRNQRISLNLPGKYSNNVQESLTGRCKMLPGNVRGSEMKSEYIIWTMPIIDILANESKYQCWAGTEYLNFMVVKKTKRGFDFIDEYMVGIGFTYNAFMTPGCETEIQPNGWETKYYLKKPKLCEQYINYLLSEKYVGASFDADKDMLLELRMKYGISGNDSLYFGNSFYKLCPDYYYDDDTPCQISNSTYGHAFHELHALTATVHYSIQKRGNALEDLFLKIFISVFSILYLIYGGYCTIKYHNQKSKKINRTYRFHKI